MTRHSQWRKGHKIALSLLGAILGLIVLIAIIATATSHSSSNSSAASAPSSPAAASAPSSSQELISKLQSTTASDGNSLYSDLQTAGLNPVTLANELCGGQTSVSVPAGWDTSDEQAFDNAVSSTMCPGTSLTPAAPAYTVAQQQAITAAEQYLSDGTGFSRQGLIQQLDSSDGSGFSESLAVFAVNHVQVNWDQQAVDAAKGYMQEGGFSYSSLVQQLDSPYGSGFTYSQAVYAAQQVGL